MSNWKNKVITWETIILICIVCMIMVGLIVVYFTVNPTDMSNIAKTCLQWARANDCICGITAS